MMDEDYKHWIYINRATTNSNDSTVEQKFTCILKCYKCKDVYISYDHASVYKLCVYTCIIFIVNTRWLKGLHSKKVV